MHEERLMKFANLVLVSALAIGAAGLAFAQETPAPPPRPGLAASAALQPWEILL